MLLGTLEASLLGNILSGRGMNRASKGQGIKRAGKSIRMMNSQRSDAKKIKLIEKDKKKWY